MDWKTFKDELRLKREQRRSFSMLILAEEGIDFTSRNEGVHLVIVDHGITYDFWPSTGKWCRRCTAPKYFRGLRNLIDTIKKGRPR